MAMTMAAFKAMFPDDALKTGLVDTFMEQSVIIPLLNFIPVDGFTYRYGEQAKLPGIGFRNINGTYTDDEGVINPRDEKLVPFGGSCKTDQWMVDLRGGRARTTQIANKIRAAGLFFDWAFFKGDSAVNAMAFDGLQARINAAGGQCFWAGAHGGALTLGLVNEALDAVHGPNTGKVIHCSKSVRRKLTALALAAAGGAAVLDTQKQLTEYDGARIVPVEEDNAGNAILGYDETRGNSAVTTSLYVVKYGSSSDETDVQGLSNSGTFKTRQPVNMGEYVRDVIEMLSGIGIFHGRAVARVGGILNQ